MARKQAFQGEIASTSDQSDTIEDYMQGIWILASRGEPVIGARLAEWLAVKPPTVTKTLQRMIESGLITMDQHKQIHMTSQGLALAETIVRRHRVLERFLTDILGLRWHEVHAEAHRMEHAISPMVEQRIMALMGNPATCPHGSPIPGQPQPERRPAQPLTSYTAGARLCIQRIAEEAEDDLQLMEYLEQTRLIPGSQLVVLEVAPWADTMSFAIDEQRITLGMRTAGYIWAEREP